MAPSRGHDYAPVLTGVKVARPDTRARPTPTLTPPPPRQERSYEGAMHIRQPRSFDEGPHYK